MQAKTWIKSGIFFLTLLFFFIYVLEIDSLARVGGGRSFGSRGSKSFSAPRSPAPSPARPSGQYASPARPASPAPFQQPQGSSFWRSMAGGVLGGMIGGMLFRSLGFGGGAGMGGGIGLFDIILIGALLYGIYWFIKRKRQTAVSGVYYRETGAGAEPIKPAPYPPSAGVDARADAETDGGDEIYRGIGHIRQMDSGFDESRFREARTDDFFRIQGAWAARDMSPVRHLLTEEMFGVFQGEAEKLISERKTNKLDNIAVRTVDIVEAWQEEGKDFITVKFLASLVDYITDESGNVISGSRTEPVKFEEYWTFTRPVGNNPWVLSAVTQPQ